MSSTHEGQGVYAPRVEGRVSWLSLFTTARAPLFILLIAAAALLIPAQMADMLDAFSVNGGAGIAVAPSFHVSLSLLTISAWYWSRALLAARFNVKDNRQARNRLLANDPRVDAFAFDIVPRAIFVIAVLLGIGVIVKSRSWYDFVPLAFWAIPLGVFVVYRMDLVKKAPSNEETSDTSEVNTAALTKTFKFRQWRRQLWPRFLLLLRRAPFSDWFSLWPALVAFLIAIAGFIFGALESFIVWGAQHESLPAFVAHIFPGPSSALLAMAMMIAPFAVLTFLADGLDLSFNFKGRSLGFRRPPVMVPLFVWIVAMPALVSLHTVRVTGEPLQPRRDLGMFLNQWTAACGRNGTVRPVIVAISGGASRAAIWGARILDEVEKDVSGTDKAAVFAVSSVSGGSLGAAAYFTLLANMSREDRCAVAGPQSRESKLAPLASPKFAQDALGPLLAGALFVDIPRALFGPFAYVFRTATGVQPRGGDRAEAIERAFDQLWLEAQPSVPGQVGITFSSPFLSLFYDGSNIREGMPLWIANGTDLRTGTRLLTVPFDTRGPWPFLGASDVLSALGSDVPISTAINNTARFPYLEPSGELLRYQIPGEPEPKDTAKGSEQIIDGGYFENEGLQTALDLADWIETQRGTNARIGQPIIVQATGSGDAIFVPASIIRCGNANDDPSEVTPGPLPLEVVAPFIGLYSVRSGHSDIVLRQTRNRYCGGQAQSFFHFFLPGLKTSPDAKSRTEVALNWVLSSSTHDFIWGAIDDAESGNADERSRMAKALNAP